ncbi:MAG: methionine biosynthesis protein MetW [Desulfatitalea sp.]|nr:methionine biosynthesis protein MetW [Desulfatitalea sp.]NNJ98798.1 methionine biosynthesis protein MetW [Desulfatitalea sp.]
MNSQYVDRLSLTDRDVILTLVPEGVSVLDLGCGDCSLLRELADKRRVRGTGVDIDGRQLADGLALGFNVYQGDLDAGLADFSNRAYDYVICNQTLQVVKDPQLVLNEVLRIGRYGIVGFPNFAQWQLRRGLFFGGRAPKSPALPFEWYDTPNIRVLSIRDFFDYCRQRNIRIVEERYLIAGRWMKRHPMRMANVLSHIGLFVITLQA